MNDLKEYIGQAANEQLLSSQAKRLQEKLALIKDNVESSKRRWFWELLQNASDYNKSVSVRLIVTSDKVEFLHNGAPFSVKDVLNVIAPDSGKDDDENEANKDSIGKFGTGLVSTHILSSKMQVKGIFRKSDDQRLFEFALNLNRWCFENKKHLIDEMAEVRNEFVNAEHRELACSEGFNTSFAYILNNPLPKVPAMSAADIDLDYLYAVLPYTLCFMSKVKTVEIEDKRNNSHHTFYISRKVQTDNHVTFEIKRNGVVSTMEFAYFKYKEVESAFCYENNRIIQFPNNIAKMFCGLPLIGMEDIGLPFILNSLSFTPSQERNGVVISPRSNPKNRELLVDSVELYGKILDYIETNEMDCAYNLAHMSRKYNGDQESNTQFVKVGIENYVNKLLNHTVVRSQSGDFISFRQTRLPFNDSKLDEKLYEYATFVADRMLPQVADYKSWFEATDFTLFTEQKYTYKMLAAKIEQTGKVSAFGKSLSEVNTWLKNCLAYIKECDKYIFSERRLLPNQLGELQLYNKLSVDEQLPKELKDIYNMLYEADSRKIETELLDSEFIFLDIVTQSCDIGSLSNRIDDKVAKIYNYNNCDVSSISRPLNKLYAWMSQSGFTKEQLQVWYKWYYPKRAGLIVDMLTETQREQALIIAQSGKMEALASLASANLTEYELAMLVANIGKLPMALSYILDNVDDRSFANQEEGELGEGIVYKELMALYPKRKGYSVIWASKEENEPCYDFVVKKKEEVVCYCDAKTTKRGIANADSIPFFMRRSQWEFLQTLNECIPYYIARVFLGDNNAVKFVRIMDSFTSK